MAARARKKKPTRVAESAIRYAPRRLLLDTHVWIWWYTDDDRLGRRTRTLIKHAEDVRVSAASAWEMAIKRSLGKLAFDSPIDLGAEIERDGFIELPITMAHAEATLTLPLAHRDPFDRMLIAQAQTEGLALVTVDDALAHYDVPIVDARS
jgi:PIN domain nuclease of toxin-antitoxin system